MKFKDKFDKEFAICYNNELDSELNVFIQDYNFNFNNDYCKVLKKIANPSEVLLFLSLVRFLCNNLNEVESNELTKFFKAETVLFYIMHFSKNRRTLWVFSKNVNTTLVSIF